MEKKKQRPTFYSSHRKRLHLYSGSSKRKRRFSTVRSAGSLRAVRFDGTKKQQSFRFDFFFLFHPLYVDELAAAVIKCYYTWFAAVNGRLKCVFITRDDIF